MTTEEIQQVRERCEKATPGPWEVDIETEYDEYYPLYTYVNAITPLDIESFRVDDAEFIAASRSDVPALLIHIATLEATITNLRTPPDPALIPELLAELHEMGADRWTDSITPRIARILFAHITTLEARTEAMAAVVAAVRQVHLLGACYQCDDSESGDALNDLDAAFAALNAQAGEVMG